MRVIAKLASGFFFDSVCHATVLTLAKCLAAGSGSIGCILKELDGTPKESRCSFTLNTVFIKSRRTLVLLSLKYIP